MDDRAPTEKRQRLKEDQKNPRHKKNLGDGWGRMTRLPLGHGAPHSSPSQSEHVRNEHDLYSQREKQELRFIVRTHGLVAASEDYDCYGKIGGKNN